MPASAKTRSRARTQDSLRPGWMLNFLLLGMLLAAIGGCYLWLQSRKKDRADQIQNLHREIALIEQQIKEKELLIHRRLAPAELELRSENAGLNLKPIEIGRKNHLIHLPEPLPETDNAPSVQGKPVIAGNLIP